LKTFRDETIVSPKHFEHTIVPTHYVRRTTAGAKQLEHHATGARRTMIKNFARFSIVAALISITTSAFADNSHRNDVEYGWKERTARAPKTEEPRALPSPAGNKFPKLRGGFEPHASTQPISLGR